MTAIKKVVQGIVIDIFCVFIGEFAETACIFYVYSHAFFATQTTFGLDNNDTVSCLCTIRSCCCRSFDHIDRSNIVHR
ncbi:hypothetical protein D3C73_728420 [compost metagenome]